MTLPDTLEGRYLEFLSRLDQTAAAAGRKRPRRRHGDAYTACCPAHDDRNPSLSMRLEGGHVLLHCFSGCSFEDICESVGMPQEALFGDYHGEPEKRPRIKWNGASITATAALTHEDVGQFAEGPLPLPLPIREFLDHDFPPTEPLLGPLTTQQIVLLYAPSGVGKTMFALALAARMANGDDFIGWRAHRRARVLVVDGEMAGEMMQRRMARVVAEDDYLRVANLPNWAASNGYDPINLCTDSGAATIGVWADALSSDVIILDNLMSLAWMDGVSMNSDEFWSPVRRFAVAQRAAGRTVIVVDHTNKSGELHGTGTKLWHADLALKLASMGEDDPVLTDGKLACPTPRFSLAFQKVRGTTEIVSHGLSDTDERVVHLGEVGQDWKHDSSREEKQTRARQMAINGMTIRDIAEELGVPKSTVARWTKGLRR